jgi:hypothetical protein
VRDTNTLIEISVMGKIKNKKMRIGDKPNNKYLFYLYLMQYSIGLIGDAQLHHILLILLPPLKTREEEEETEDEQASIKPTMIIPKLSFI